MDAFLTSNGQLGMTYNLWPTVPIAQNDVIEPYLDAAQDCPGEDPENEVVYDLSRENLINEVIIRWRHNWATNTEAAEYDYVYAPSQSAYQIRKAKNFTLKGIRTYGPSLHLDSALSLATGRAACLRDHALQSATTLHANPGRQLRSADLLAWPGPTGAWLDEAHLARD